MKDEERKDITEKKKKKRKRHNGKNSQLLKSADHETLFAVILAALSSTKSNSKAVIQHCLNQLHLSLPRNLSVPLLSLVPTLLNSKWNEIASKTADIVGTASLTSFEMNEMISSQDGVIKGLISLLKLSNTSVQMAASNAILDLSTTQAGRCQLQQFFAIESLIECLLQVPKSTFTEVLWTDGKTGGTSARIVLDFEACISLLHSTIALINSCTVQQLQAISQVLCRRLLIYLKDVWEEIHEKMLCSSALRDGQDDHCYLSNITSNDLAETIFRVSVNDGRFKESSHLIKVERCIFRSEETSFEHFVLNNWERSPLLMRDTSEVMRQEGIFKSFIQLFESKYAMPSSLTSFLRTLTSCPPIASDELDVLHFLKLVRSHLGCPLIYQQDIRVLKVHDSEKELHYFKRQSESSGSSTSQCLVMDDIMKCEEAYNDGYTIAVRGMEFRCKCIAAISEGLATLYGQPSTGVNMYLTPPNSQGLGCHIDDHCVFVCQLIGAKQWTIFPRPSDQLPRLYDPVDTWHPPEVDEGGQQLMLREGDVLYIPRGFPHKAHTNVRSDGPEKTAGFSLHMTLAIEVERPFEWEGFIHVALHQWDLKQNTHHKLFGDSTISSNVHLMVVTLMHVAVKLIANLDPTFRKACLTAAISSSSSSSHPEEWLSINQRMIFNTLISRINNELDFRDALKHVETCIRKDEDPFQELRWLQHLMQDCKTVESCHWNIAMADAHDCLSICNQRRDLVEAAFAQVKSKFCCEVVFEDVQESYKTLLEKYRKVRKQYTSGMLSLQCIEDRF